MIILISSTISMALRACFSNVFWISHFSMRLPAAWPSHRWTRQWYIYHDVSRNTLKLNQRNISEELVLGMRKQWDRNKLKSASGPSQFFSVHVTSYSWGSREMIFCDLSCQKRDTIPSTAVYVTYIGQTRESWLETPTRQDRFSWCWNVRPCWSSH